MDLVDANKLVKTTREDADLGLTYRKGTVVWDQSLEVLACADSSHGNVDDEKHGEKTRSQGGYVITITNKDSKYIHAVETTSFKIRRVCRSSVAAECNGLLEAAEALDYIREVLALLLDRDRTMREAAAGIGLTPARWYTDAKPLVHLVCKETSIAADKRLRILIAQLREMSEDPQVSVHWVDTKLMLADSLTKVGAERHYLISALEDNFWDYESNEYTLALKESIRVARRARHEKIKTTVHGSDRREESK